MKKCVVLFSGGQDSTTCLFWALRHFDIVEALSVDYGQRHAIELDRAAVIAKSCGVKHTILNVPALGEIGGNALTDPAMAIERREGEMPNTFVPGRNLLFMVLAASYAYVHDIHDMVMGVCQADYSGYPDCREEAIRAMAQAIALGMDYDIRIHTPLMHCSKEDMLRMAECVGAIEHVLGTSHTCYKGIAGGCGECPACAIRTVAERSYKRLKTF